MYNMQPYAVTDIGHWTLGLVLFLLLRIVLIYVLAAKPNKSIIILYYINTAPTHSFARYKRVKI